MKTSVLAQRLILKKHVKNPSDSIGNEKPTNAEIWHPIIVRGQLISERPFAVYHISLMAH